jgi:hypothetical protein
MGVDYTTHIGPFVECHTFKKDSVEKYRGCDNRICGEYHERVYNEIIFCSRCGSKIEEVSIPKKENKISIQEVIEEMDENLMPPFGDYMCDWMAENDIDLWLPNKGRPDKGARKFSFDPHDGIQFAVMNEKMIWGEISEFTNQFRKELSVLRRHYGVENVTVKWGLIHMIH